MIDIECTVLTAIAIHEIFFEKSCKLLDHSQNATYAMNHRERKQKKTTFYIRLNFRSDQFHCKINCYLFR